MKNYTELAELREKAAGLHSELAQFSDRVEKGETFDDETIVKFNTAKDEYDATSKRIKSLESADNIRQLLSSRVAPGIRITDKTVSKFDYDNAFRAFAANGHVNVKDAWKRSADKLNVDWQSQVMEFAQSSDTAGEGQELVQGSVWQALIEAKKAYGGIEKYCEVFTTSTGTPLKWTADNDTGNVATVSAQNAAITQVGHTFSNVSLGVWDYTTATSPVSYSLIQDAVFDVSSYVGKTHGNRLGRAIAADECSGNGSSKITGLMANTTEGTTGTHAALTAANIKALFFSVDKEYRDSPSCAWLMSDTTLSHLMDVLVDSTNKPIWGNGLNSDPTLSLIGKPIVIVPEMDSALTSAKKPIAFGDLSFYKVRYVGGPQIYKQEVATKLSVGFYGAARVDGKLFDPGNHPIKHLTTT